MATLSPKDQRTAQANWRDKIKTLCQQNINAHERQDYITFLREKLFPTHCQSNNKAVIANLPTTTILLLIKACKHLKDWPLMIHCCEEYQKRLERAISDKLPRHSIDNLRLLSRAYQHLGLFNSAEQALQRAINHNGHPAHQSLIDDYQQLQHRTKALPKGINALRADPLILTPCKATTKTTFSGNTPTPISPNCVTCQTLTKTMKRMFFIGATTKAIGPHFLKSTGFLVIVISRDRWNW